MAQVPPPQTQPVEIDPDFEPLSRPRSCTWPLQRPEFTEPGSSNTSSPAPSVQQELGGNAEFVCNLGLLEEDYEEYTEQKPPVPSNDYQCREKNCGHLHPNHQHHHHHHRHHHHHQQQQQQQQQQQLPSPQLPLQQQVPPAGVAPLGSSVQRKSSSSRRNAWGNMSYADLITKAIDSSPDKRLTLSQIYDWMVKSVPYFKDKGDSNSSAGWKNSIRHNLSLHSRFVRIQNEGTGKSSWWMLNPEGGKNGKSPRRRAASMDNNSKFAKSRGRATKKKMALQEGVGGASSASPGSHYSNWLESPNSHSNEDFEAWSSFRTRTSSDASTLSGHHSPFPSEQDELGESDSHMIYPGAAGTKIGSTLPRLSEVAGSMGQHGSENVMESLLDNLNLLSPKNPQLGSDSSHSSNAAMLQRSPYSSSGLTPHPQQDYRKCMYRQVRVNSLSPTPMQTLQESKLGFGAYENQYICAAGLLKELLTSDVDAGRDMMPSRDTLVSQVGRRGCLMHIYSSQSHLGGHNGVKMTSPPQSHPVPQTVHIEGPSTSRDLNSRDMIPLTSMTSLSRAPTQMTSLKTCMQLPQGHSAHINDVSASYSSNKGYRELAVHPHGHHQERLPSDLDNMSIERFECDMESVLHDTLMDGGALDFNFDPAAGPHGFPQRVKTTTHSWVSG